MKGHHDHGPGDNREDHRRKKQDGECEKQHAVAGHREFRFQAVSASRPKKMILPTQHLRQEGVQ